MRNEAWQSRERLKDYCFLLGLGRLFFRPLKAGSEVLGLVFARGDDGADPAGSGRVPESAALSLVG